jgi:hypothetical protein
VHPHRVADRRGDAAQRQAVVVLQQLDDQPAPFEDDDLRLIGLRGHIFTVEPVRPARRLIAGDRPRNRYV